MTVELTENFDNLAKLISEKGTQLDGLVMARISSSGLMPETICLSGNPEGRQFIAAEGNVLAFKEASGNVSFLEQDPQVGQSFSADWSKTLFTAVANEAAESPEKFTPFVSREI